MKVSGVTAKGDQARVTIADVKDKPGIAAELFTQLANKDVIVDVIVQSSPRDGINTIPLPLRKRPNSCKTNHRGLRKRPWKWKGRVR